MARTKRPSWFARLISRLIDPHDLSIAWTIAGLLLIFESLLCVAIIRKVPYTEIDWVAYMQEVAGYDKGERDYMNLRGDTGPLVYPAGFVYLFSWLRSITGEAVLPAQYIFAALYVATQFVIMALYINTRSMPPWSLALLCFSRRLHSIFVLRLFNDCWAMFVAYIATWALQRRKWAVAIFLYSLAVSVKMNVLLFAPGVLVVMIKEARFIDVFKGVTAGVLLQLLLGLPFLTTFPKSYLARAFEFSRVFMFKWSVNWQFLSEELFLSPRFALLLLLLHLRLLWSFAQYQWFKPEGGIFNALAAFFQRKSKSTDDKGASSQFDNDSFLKIVFISNYIGIVCSRTLHYQFYSWYFHTLPYMLFRTRFPAILSVSFLFLMEAVWNIFPPRAETSLLLLGLHLTLLIGCWALPAAPVKEKATTNGVRASRKRT